MRYLYLLSYLLIIQSALYICKQKPPPLSMQLLLATKVVGGLNTHLYYYFLFRLSNNSCINLPAISFEPRPTAIATAKPTAPSKTVIVVFNIAVAIFNCSRVMIAANITITVCVTWLSNFDCFMPAFIAAVMTIEPITLAKNIPRVIIKIAAMTFGM